jgi:hypothetical protein
MISFPDPEDPWECTDPGVFAGVDPPVPVADLTSTAVTPSSWLLDHGPTVRYQGKAYRSRSRWARLILGVTRGRLHRGRRAFPWRES